MLESFASDKDINKLLLIDSFDKEDKYTKYLKKLLNKYDLSNKIIFFNSNHYSINLIYNISDFIVLPSISTEKMERAVWQACRSIFL